MITAFEEKQLGITNTVHCFAVVVDTPRMSTDEAHALVEDALRALKTERYKIVSVWPARLGVFK